MRASDKFEAAGLVEAGVFSLGPSAVASVPSHLPPSHPSDVWLAQSLTRDTETQGHCRRLSSLAARFGAQLLLAEADIAALRVGGMVHDVGKLFVPAAILHKPAPLTESERMIVREHPVLGERLCAPFPALNAALPIVRYHHERLDGSGYPDHLAGERIPLNARIMQIVDVFDALTAARPYKPAWSVAQALDTMRAEATRGWMDLRLLREFAALCL